LKPELIVLVLALLLVVAAFNISSLPSRARSTLILLALVAVFLAWLHHQETKPSRHTRVADRLASIRLRMTIGRELDDRGITTPADIGAALGMPPAEATKLLTLRQWREGDVARLEAAAARLGLQVQDP
jgi:hypothetical protein